MVEPESDGIGVEAHGGVHIADGDADHLEAELHGLTLPSERNKLFR